MLIGNITLMHDQIFFEGKFFDENFFHVYCSTYSLSAIANKKFIFGWSARPLSAKPSVAEDARRPGESAPTVRATINIEMYYTEKSFFFEANMIMKFLSFFIRYNKKAFHFSEMNFSIKDRL